MSINLTQQFVFETDELVALEKMLHAIAPIVLDDNPKFNRLTVSTNGESFWDDNDWDFKHGPFIYPTGKETLILEHSATYGGAGMLHLVESCKTKDAAANIASKEQEKRNKRKPTRLFICSLSDENREGSTPCKDYTELVAVALKHVRDFDSKKFFKKCGDGFNSGFLPDDGDVSYGYRIQGDPGSGGADTLIISMVHMYYGK